MFAPKIAKPQEKAGEGSTSTLAQHRTMSVAHPDGYDPLLNEPGLPLDTAALSDFQTSFGHDFSAVRVHTDEQAAASAASHSARAYTIGSHVVFGRGEYAPGTPTGRHLLGHELAHVVQQSRGGPSASGAQNASLEAAADHAANQASRGTSVMVAGSSAVGIACKTLFEELTGGKYMWSLLRDVLDLTRPVASIVTDVNALTAAERDQAITDITRTRVERACKWAFQAGQQSALTDPKDRAFLDPSVAESKRILDRYDAVLDGLAPAGTVRTKIPGWNFTPEDYAKLRGAQKDLTMAPDSSWFPAKLQENLLKTLAFVLGPTVPVPVDPLSNPLTSFCKATKISPPATEGVNALDFFHGHLVIKKDPATTKEAKAAEKTAEKFQKDVSKARKKAIGSTSYVSGYRMDDKKIAAYTEALEKVAPTLTGPMETISKIPGAAVMYHTYEFMSPFDLMVKGQKRKSDDPRRHYVTPVDTNTPRQYTPPSPATYEKEFTHIAQFAFLVDTKGEVHVRPLEMSTGLTTLELSTITGTTFPEPFEFPE
ncbi:MAG TPA: DUF4157 domain-containing protein [Pyrinomonadaceae bacterium]|nr:DUF4157 domain-containing protein [Pyrinomonadaceae bacterium]